MRGVNQVCTYYAPVAGMDYPRELLFLWEESWQANGWSTTILGIGEAREHPSFEMFKNRLVDLPSVNPANYDSSCHMRHMAMAAVGGGLLTDYDVINRSFSPEMADEIMDRNKLTILEPTRVPCAVLGTADGFEDLCDLIFNYEMQPEDRVNGRPHISDMHIVRKSNLPTTSHCVELLCSGEPIRDHAGNGWKHAPMLHCANFAFQKLGWKAPKHLLISRALRELL